MDHIVSALRILDHSVEHNGECGYHYWEHYGVCPVERIFLN